ncbi:MAG: PaaI family thioesterase [Cyclobacteriaceae bacterium]|nr:PaaI family thioesterase [Cyclobacteriaceae bacterium]
MNPDFKQRIEKHLLKQEFMHHIGFNLDLIEAGKVEGKMDLKKIHLQQAGLVHGGVIATVADIVAGFSAYSLVGLDEKVVTGELKISYLRPAKGDVLWAKGWVLKQGRKINFCEAEVYVLNGNDPKLIAKATTSMIII